MWVKTRRQYTYLMTALSVVTLAFAVAGLAFGAVSLPVTTLMDWLQAKPTPDTFILQQLRLPRVLLASLVGATLAVCGVAAQALFRNPLADPSLIGVSAGASLGASIAIVLLPSIAVSGLGLSLVSLCAFVGAWLSVGAVYLLARTAYGTSVSTLLLAGVGVAFFAASITGLLEFVADQQSLRQISLWRMGGLEGADYRRVGVLLVVMLVVLLCLFGLAPRYDLLLLGEAEARHLGVAVHRLKLVTILAIAAGVGTTVALAGSIAFVGLVVPHLARGVVGPGHKRLLPVSLVLGAGFVMLADVLSRTVLAPVELPAGLLIALVGAPMFLLMLRHRYSFGGPP